MKKAEREQIEKAKCFIGGRPGAKCFQGFNRETKEFYDFWIGRLAGRNVSCQESAKHPTREAAIEDAKAFRAHARQIASNPTK